MNNTVLVVDDELSVRTVVRVQLQLAGYRVIEAATGDEALAKLDEHEPCVVLLDLRMPGVDGWEVLEQLHESGRLERVPVLLFSAHASAEELERGIELGCSGLVKKPFRQADLLDAVGVAVASG